jgi:hypothetical protein
MSGWKTQRTNSRSSMTSGGDGRSLDLLTPLHADGRSTFAAMAHELGLAYLAARIHPPGQEESGISTIEYRQRLAGSGRQGAVYRLRPMRKHRRVR